MKVTFERGQLQVDVGELLSLMTLEEKRQIADLLACQCDVIEFVTEQIIERWTSEGSHGYTGTPSPEPYTGLDKAWRAVAIASGDIAKREIERLSKELMRVHGERNAYADRYHALCRRQGQLCE